MLVRNLQNFQQNEGAQRGSVPCMIGMNSRQCASACIPPSGAMSCSGSKGSVMDKLLTMLKSLPNALPDGPIAEPKIVNFFKALVLDY